MRCAVGKGAPVQTELQSRSTARAPCPRVRPVFTLSTDAWARRHARAFVRQNCGLAPLPTLRIRGYRSMLSALLLDRKIPLAYERAPFLRLLLDERGKRLRRGRHGFEHLRRQKLFRERLIHQNAADCAVDLEHDVARGARGGKQ